MVTQDLETGDRSVLSIAVNEGARGGGRGPGRGDAPGRHPGRVRAPPRRRDRALAARLRARRAASSSSGRAGPRRCSTRPRSSSSSRSGRRCRRASRRSSTARASPPPPTSSSRSWAASSTCCRSARSTRARGPAATRTCASSTGTCPRASPRSTVRMNEVPAAMRAADRRPALRRRRRARRRGAPIPLDGYDTTGIRRLLAIRLAARGQAPRREAAARALSSTWPTWTCASSAATDFARAGARTPTSRARSSTSSGRTPTATASPCSTSPTPTGPRYAEHRGDYRQNVGSVGKLVVALSLFQALADAWPDDLAKRTAVLRETVVTADALLAVGPPHRALLRPEDDDARAADDPRSATRARSTSSSTGCSRRARTRRRGWSCARRCCSASSARPTRRPEAEIQRFFKETPEERPHRALRADVRGAGHAQRPRRRSCCARASFFTHRGQADRPGAGRELRLGARARRATWCSSSRGGSSTSSRAARSSGSST